MVLQVYKYRNLIPTVKSICLTHERNGKDPRQAASEVAVALAMPVIAAMIFIGELYGFTEELEASISRVTTFYGYTGVER